MRPIPDHATPRCDGRALRRWSGAGPLAATALTCLLALAPLARAWTSDGATFSRIYQPAPGSALATAGCSVCHRATARTLNPYGVDLGNAMTAKATRDVAAYKAIESLDSDKDGAANLAEIKAGTLPGDAASKPRR